MEILNRLLEITIYSAVLFLAIMAIKTIFKKHMSPALHFAVWFILIARLCIPVTIDSGLKLFAVPGLAVLSNDAAPEQQGAFAGASPEQPDIQSNTVIPHNTNDVQYIPAPVNNKVQSNADLKSAAVSWQDMLLAVWICGMLAQGARMAISAARMTRIVKTAGKKPDARVQEVMEACRAELGIKKTVPVYVLRDITTPALTAGVSPKMILPCDMAAALSAERLSFAVKHELMHYKRKDHILSILLRVLEAIYWFNPVVLLMGRFMTADMETACDSMVVRTLGPQGRKLYALTLVDMFSQKKKPQFLLGMALDNTGKIAEKRIRGVFMRDKSRRSVRVIAAVLSAALVVCCFTTACQPTPEKPPVANKGGDTLESALAATAAPELTPSQTAGADKNTGMIVSGHWTDSTASKLTTVNIDADVLTPDVAAYPVYEVSPLVVDKALAEKFVNYVAKDANVIKNGSSMSKEDLEDAITRLQMEIAKAENGNQDPDDDMSPEERIAFTEQQLETYENEYNKLVAEGDTSGQPLDYTFKPEMGFPERTVVCFNAEMKDGSDRLLRFERSNEGGPTFSLIAVMDESELKERTGSPVSSEEARETALQVVNELGIGEYYLAEENITDCFNELVFNRLYDGIPVTLIDHGNGNSSGVVTEDELKYNFVLWQESLRICVNDSGVILVDWATPCGVTRTVNENVALKPLEEIEEVFKQQILYNVYEADGEKNTMQIDEMRLGYMVIPQKDDPSIYRTIPVWDFIGPDTADPSIIAKMKEQGIPVRPLSYLTVNAIDGSIIDRGLGY